MIWILTAAVTVGSRTSAMAGPQRTIGGGIGGICTALRARGVELDAGVTAHALTFLDGISLTRTEAVSLSFRHEISRVAWDDLANELSEQMKDRARKRWTVQQAAGAGEAIRSKDMVVYAQKEKIASDYVDEIVDMNVYELACKGRILSEVYPSADDYDIFIRFSSGDKVLCEGFFDLVGDITILGGFNIINLDDADLSQWPEMEDFLKCIRLPLTATSEDVIRESFFEMKPWKVVFTVIAIHKQSLQPSIIFSENQRLDCESGERAWGDEDIDIERQEVYVDINMTMDFAARHGGEYDLNDVNLRPHSRDPRQFVQGDLSLRPVVPDQKYGWTRWCSLEFDSKTPGAWRMEFYDLHKQR